MKFLFYSLNKAKRCLPLRAYKHVSIAIFLMAIHKIHKSPLDIDLIAVSSSVLYQL